MHTFPYFDDFVIYYRIYETSDAMWHAWNAAQDFDADEFEEAVPDLLPQRGRGAFISGFVPYPHTLIPN